MMKTIINVIIVAIAVIATLLGGLVVIAVGCSYGSTAGTMTVDLSHIFSLFGLFLLIIGIVILVKKLKKHENILHICILVYGILLMIASVFVNIYSRKVISENSTWADVVVPPNGFSVLVALIAIFGLLSYPFIKENKGNDFYIKR